jgi:multidrug resistance protein, MATE family
MKPAATKAAEEARHLLRLAFPLALGHAGLQLMSVVDVAVVGRLGAIPLAGVGIANAFFFFALIFASGVAMGTDPFFAQYFGAGLADRARRVLWQGVWLTAALSLALLPLFFSAGLLMSAFGIEPLIASDAKRYLDIRALSLFPSLLYVVLRGYLQAKETTGAIVGSIVIANLVNLGANLLLVFGGSNLPAWVGPLRELPAFGLVGAAWASVFATVVQVLILIAAVRKTGRSTPGVVRRPDPTELGRILRIGTPVGLQMGAEVAIFALVGLLSGRLGPAEVAAHQIALSLAAMSFTVAVGIGTAGGVRVGHEIGAGRRDGPRLAGMVAFASGTACMFVASLIFLLFPGAVARVITNDPAVIATVVPLLAVAAVFQISDGIQAVGAGVLRGAGDTTFTFLANLVGHWLIGFPVAIWVGFHLNLGVTGLWWGLCAGLTAVALSLLARFHLLSNRGFQSVIDRKENLTAPTP